MNLNDVKNKTDLKLPPSIYDVCRQYCRENFITLKQFVEKSGVAFTTIQRSVKSDITPKTLKKLADSMSVNPTELLSVHESYMDSLKRGNVDE